MAEAGPRGRALSYDVVGPEGAPLLVLLGPLGTTNAVWGRRCECSLAGSGCYG